MAKAKPLKEPLKLMVSSTVYGIEELLDQVYAMLSTFGYEVWVSHKGTVTVYPTQTALESCLKAVEECDLFLSIITPRYGSGVVAGQESITHQELLYQDRKGNWVQRFSNSDDVKLFATAQFSRYHQVEQFLGEQFQDVQGLKQKTAVKDVTQ